MSLLDRLFKPTWAGPWTLFRWLYVLIALVTHLPRVGQLRDAYASQDLVLAWGLVPLANWWVLSPTSAAVLWALGVLGLGCVAWGGRAAKPGLVLWVVASWLLLAAEAMNLKAYDRLLVWQALALLFAPIGERNLTAKWRSPLGRHIMLIVYIGMYTMTGWAKLLLEPHWRDGTALAYILVERNFGQTTLGALLSTNIELCKALSWATIAFEIAFPVLVFVRKLNPWVLLAGVLFHLGIFATLHAGTLSFVTIFGYVVLLSPETARDWWARLTQTLPDPTPSAAR